jgi:hypothetical protein
MRRKSLAIIAATLLATVFAVSPAKADSAGTAMYTPTTSNESNAYARVIQLKYDNNRLLGTFEHWFSDGTKSQYIIRSSAADGKSWSTIATVSAAQMPVSQMWQPSLFEFPKRIGKYPAGTILLMGNLVPADGSSTVFYSWRSTDHGHTWSPVGEVQRGGTFGKGIWEPFIRLDEYGRLVTYFSDERDSPTHSQMLDEIISSDGGDSWGKATPVVASAVAADRPGMASVAQIGNSHKYVMSYEFCGHANCEVRIKYSNDAVNWGPATDIGERVVSTDNRYLGHSPYIAWLPKQKELVLAGQNVYSTVSNQPTDENYRAVFVNSGGTWHWAPAPWKVSNASSACNANYSPDLLPTADGQLRYTAPTSTGSSGPCAEGTGAAPIDVLPFRDNFAAGSDAGWADYGGTWQLQDGVYAATSGGPDGPVALTGTTGWTNYTIAADVEITSSAGDAGVVARVGNPAVGADSHQGYLAFFDVGAKAFTIARQDYSYEPLASAPVTGVSANTWYRISFTVRGSDLTASMQPVGGGAATKLHVNDPYDSFPSGLAGVRDHAGTASFRNVSITAG